MRTLVCLGVVLALVTVASADDAKKHMKGKIVRVNADGNAITVRTEDNKEVELKANDTTKFFGTDKKPLSGGLKSTEFKEGTEIWYKVGTGAEATTITMLHLYNPDTEK